MIEISTYKPEYKHSFIELNKQWIKDYFHIEKHDVETFSNIEKSVLSDGGEIFFAIDEGVVVGCCALVHHSSDNRLGEWELAKMAVASSHRGKGIGSILMKALLDNAKRRGIKSIYLEGNTRLTASIKMYRKFGFREVALEGRNYERVDIIMRWNSD